MQISFIARARTGWKALVCVALLSSAMAASADPYPISRVTPAAPRALQPIRARVLIQGCNEVRNVEFAQGRIRINVGNIDIECGVPVPMREQEVSLGSLPAGRYGLDVIFRDAVIAPVDGSPTEIVVAPATTSQRGNPGRLVDETGAWWNPQLPGTAVFILDSVPDSRFVVWNTYDDRHQPTFYVLQLVGFGSTQGDIYRSTGTPAGNVPVPGDFSATRVGLGTLLRMGPERIGLEYQLDGHERQILNLERFAL